MEKLSTAQLTALQAANNGALQWVFPRRGVNGGYRIQDTPGCNHCGTTSIRVATGAALLSRGFIAKTPVARGTDHYTSVIITPTGETALEHANA